MKHRAFTVGKQPKTLKHGRDGDYHFHQLGDNRDIEWHMTQSRQAAVAEPEEFTTRMNKRSLRLRQGKSRRVTSKRGGAK